MTIYILSCIEPHTLKELLYADNLTWSETDLKVSEDPGGHIPTILKSNREFKIKELHLLALEIPIIITDLWFFYTEVMLDARLNACLRPYNDNTISRQKIVEMVQAVDWTQQADRYKQVKTLRLIGID